MTIDQLKYAALFGQPGCLIRLAEWLDLDIPPTDSAALDALIWYYTLGFHITAEPQFR